MLITKGTILYINSDDLLSQFKGCDTNKVNFARLKREVMIAARDAEAVIFIEDRVEEGLRDRLILKLDIPEEFQK